MIPHRTPFVLPLLYPSLHWRFPSRAKQLFLTFDDGPIPGPTEFVLDCLANYGIKATFFCIGNNIHKNPLVFRRILDEGHQTGNHTYHHVSGWSKPSKAYLDDIALCDQILGYTLDTCVKKPFRPPYGRISRKQIALLAGRPIIMWDVLSQDYNPHLSPDRCLHNTLKAIRSGSIIVFHDSIKAESNLVHALPRLVEECLTRGYSFSPICQ